MAPRYKHLQPEDRLTLASLVQQRLSQRSIVRLLGAQSSTICRKFAHNGHTAQGYAFKPAQAAREVRRAGARPAPKLHVQGALWQVVCDHLLWRWPPQQIARTLRAMPLDVLRQHASHESIYHAIYVYFRGEEDAVDRAAALGAQWMSSSLGRARLADAGGVEDDLIKRANNQFAVGVLVERGTRLVLLCRMPRRLQHSRHWLPSRPNLTGWRSRCASGWRHRTPLPI
jgi:IS30 family transposase